MVKATNIKFCKGCGTFLKIEGGYLQERCQSCAPKVEELRARRSATMKRKVADPVYRALLLERMAMARATLDQSLIDRSKQAKSLSERHMAWCPEEYRDYYRRLRSRQVYDPATGKWPKVGAKVARKKIEKSFGGPLKPLVITTADVSRHQCRVDGKTVSLGPAQLTMLLHLVGTRPDHYVSAEELIRVVWPNANNEPDDADSVIKSQIHRLRGKGVCIVNVHGKGYRIAPQVRATA